MQQKRGVATKEKDPHDDQLGQKDGDYEKIPPRVYQEQSVGDRQKVERDVRLEDGTKLKR